MSSQQVRKVISERVACLLQQRQQQANAQALQQGLQGISLHQQTPHGLQGAHPFDMRASGHAHAMASNQARHCHRARTCEIVPLSLHPQGNACLATYNLS